MSTKIRAATVDDRRRLVLPEDFPPNCPVTVQQLDDDTLVVKRQRASRNYKIVLIPAIHKLPDDPEWEAIERKMADHTSKKVPPFEE